MPYAAARRTRRGPRTAAAARRTEAAAVRGRLRVRDGLTVRVRLRVRARRGVRRGLGPRAGLAVGRAGGRLAARVGWGAAGGAKGDAVPRPAGRTATSPPRERGLVRRPHRVDRRAGTARRGERRPAGLVSRLLAHPPHRSGGGSRRSGSRRGSPAHATPAISAQTSRSARREPHRTRAVVGPRADGTRPCAPVSDVRPWQHRWIRGRQERAALGARPASRVVDVLTRRGARRRRRARARRGRRSSGRRR